MRILYVGNGAYKSRGAVYYDVGRILCNGFTRISDSHNVYFLSDRDTAKFGAFLRSQALGAGYCNKVFRDVCRNYRPELIVFANADLITIESLQIVKELLPKAKMIQICVDILVSRNNVEKLKKKMPYMDATFVTTAGSVLGTIAVSSGVVAYMPNPVDKSMEYPRCHERSDQRNDVFWALRMSGKRDLVESNPRWKIPLFLEQSGRINIDYHGMGGKPVLYGAEYFEAISNAKMGLSINQGALLCDYAIRPGHNNVYLYASDRIAHYMGSGLLVFSYRDKDLDTKLEDLFEEDRELVFFSSDEELLAKVIYYKEHDEERRRIARRGWEKCHKYLNERLVAKYIMEITFEKPFSEEYIWPLDLY